MQGCSARQQIEDGFTWGTLQVNRFRADVHCDAGNEKRTLAVAVAFGQHSGGQLRLWRRGTSISDAVSGRSPAIVQAGINSSPLRFDLLAPHGPLQWWRGERTSVI